MPGLLIARGRAADVYDAGPGRVLRRYRNPHIDSAPEAAVMQHAQRAGFPVPTVYDAAGPDLVLSRLVGPTMFELLARRPWQLGRQAELLATLHRDLAAIDAPVGLRTPLGAGRRCCTLTCIPATWC